jgi:hypothetical protein
MRQREAATMPKSIALLVIGTLVFTAGARSRNGAAANATRTGTDSATVRPDFPPISWNDPHGYRPDSLSSAEADLAFAPVIPELGDPSAISETNPSQTPKADRALAFVYDDPKYGGRFYVEELVPTLTQEHLEELATCQPGETGCSTMGWSLFTIRDGVTALLIYAPSEVSEATSLMWIENGIMFIVMGPSNSSTDSDALAVAAAI